MFRTARIIAAPLAIAAALAGATAAQASPPVIAQAQTTEAQPLVVPIQAKCEGAKRCDYAITTQDGTAVAGADYVTTTATGSVLKNQTLTTQLVIPVINDNIPEDTETVGIHVAVTRTIGKRNKIKTASFDSASFIAPSDFPGFPF